MAGTLLVGAWSINRVAQERIFLFPRLSGRARASLRIALAASRIIAASN